MGTVRRSQHSSRKAPLPAKTPCTRSTSSLTQGSLPQFPSIWLPTSPARLSRKQNKQPWKKDENEETMSNTHTSEKVYFSSFFCLFFPKDHSLRQTHNAHYTLKHTH